MRGINIMALSKKQADTISDLIRGLTIWLQAVERPDNTTEQTIQYMTWHDQHADELIKFGIRVAKYNHNIK
jgi:hypothetical protein